MAKATLWRANWPAWFVNTATRPVFGTNIKVGLYTSTWSPSPDTATGYSNTNELATENGYTRNAKAVTSAAVTYVAAASLGAWQTGAAYNVGDVIKGSGSGAGKVYRCLVAGTSGSVEPSWTGVTGERIQDNATAVYWGECGAGVLKFDFDDVVWDNLTGKLTFRYAAFYDDNATQPETKPYICYVDFETDQESGTSGSLTLIVDALGQIVMPMY